MRSARNISGQACFPPAMRRRCALQLRKYLGLRISFYRTRDGSEIRRINADTAQLQAEMWRSVEAPARAQQTPVMTLVVSGMNDVLNSQGYTQAAWWNRIPGGMGPAGIHRDRLQPVGRLWCARRRSEVRLADCSAADCLHSRSSSSRTSTARITASSTSLPRIW